jgi:hypothetical protein
MRIRPRGGSRAGARESATPFPPADSRAARALFVDDHPTLLTLLANALESKVLGTGTRDRELEGLRLGRGRAVHLDDVDREARPRGRVRP